MASLPPQTQQHSIQSSSPFQICSLIFLFLHLRLRCHHPLILVAPDLGQWIVCRDLLADIAACQSVRHIPRLVPLLLQQLRQLAREQQLLANRERFPLLHAIVGVRCRSSHMFLVIHSATLIACGVSSAII